jgi:hypothetical protein
MVRGYVPVAVLGLVDIFSVVLPVPATDVGLNEELVRVGNPLTLKPVTAEYGPRAVTDTVKLVFEPPLTV